MGDPEAPNHLVKPDRSIWTLREIYALVGTTTDVVGPYGDVSKRRIVVARPCPVNPRNAHVGYGDAA